MDEKHPQEGSEGPREVWGGGQSPQERGDPGGSSPRDNTAPPTGDARVDDAIAALSRLDGRQPDEQVAILEEVHGRLRDILGELAERPEVSEGHEQQ